MALKNLITISDYNSHNFKLMSGQAPAPTPQLILEDIVKAKREEILLTMGNLTKDLNIDQSMTRLSLGQQTKQIKHQMKILEQRLIDIK